MSVPLWNLTVLWALFCFHNGYCYGSFSSPSLECEFYSKEECTGENPDTRCTEGTTCNPAPNRRAFCMVQWKNSSSQVQVLKKGCWGEDSRCAGRSGCFEDLYKPSQYFCCCDGSYCNSNFSYQPQREITVADLTRDKQMTCEYYDPEECSETVPGECNKTRSEPDHVHCYAFLQNYTGELVIKKKGCWLKQRECASPSCIVTEKVARSEPHSESYFCCCTGKFCNVDILYIPPDPSTELTTSPDQTPTGNSHTWMTLVLSLVPIVIISFFIAVSFWLWRRKKTLLHEPLSTVDPSPIPPPSPDTALRPIQLLQVKAKGRFGCVWKATMGVETVAVKIFPPQDRQSYVVEKDIYQLPYFSTKSSILRYIGGEKRGDNPLNMEMWLITEFHRHGSLYDYLKGNLISWDEAIKMSECITNGLAFLHDNSISSNSTKFKPTVVHRDFKSKNVLIKEDLTACIADFGLAMKFDPGKHIGDTHGQVGTRRYMAPEVLEGSVTFNSDHFIRIDMYACGLVLWEIISRCSAIDGPVDEYQLPFEDVVGQHPTLEDMQDVVVQKKKRPPIKESWLTKPGLYEMCQSIQECWDSDPEARVSAGCVTERIALLSQTHLSTSQLTV